MEQKEKIGFFSIGINLLLVGIKGLLAYLSGSVALLADTIHSATDVISSITVLAGIKISRRRSKNFPYGLYKVENFVSLLTSIFIFLAGYEIVKAGAGIFIDAFRVLLDASLDFETMDRVKTIILKDPRVNRGISIHLMHVKEVSNV